MPYVIAAPEMMAAAATDLTTVGSNVSAAYAAAAAPTVAVLPAAADEVSAGIAAVFSDHAQTFQGLAGQAALLHDQFVQRLQTSAGSYAGAEAAATTWLQPLTPATGAATGSLPGPLTLLRNFLSFPLQDQILVLFVLGFIGVAPIVAIMFQLLGQTGLLG
jgi:hypothetical protein